MLSNSVAGGALGAAYMTLLMLLMNPALPLTMGAVLPVAATMALSYGVHVAVLLYAAYVVRQVFAAAPLSPGWLSLSLLTSSAAVLASIAAVLTWLNGRGFRTALEPPAAAALTRTAYTFAMCTVLFLATAVVHATTRKPRSAVAAVFLATVAASVVAPLVIRGSGGPRDLPSRRLEVAAAPAAGTPRVVLLLLEGASLDVVSPAVAEGRLPYFGRLLESGSSMHLATVRPTQPEPVWASLATGKWPPKHGIRSSARYWAPGATEPLNLLPDYSFGQALLRFGLLREEPHPAFALGARPLWQILSSRGLSSGVVGLPLTHPPESVRGFVVSDRFHRSTDPDVELGDRPAVSPPEASIVAGEALRAALLPTSRAEPLSIDLPAGGAEVAALRADRIYHAVAQRLAALHDVRLLTIRYQGLDAIGHYYLRFARPQAFGDVSEAERRLYGRVLDEYYGYVDALVGDAMGSLRDEDLLIVVSGFGMEPLSPGQRLVERIAGNARFSGTHESAPDGFFLAYGSAAAAGRASRGAIVDVTPTILYFLGLPVARDMDGFARTDIFTGTFNAQRTITFIPTYE